MTISSSPFGLPWAMRQRDVLADNRAAVPGPADPAVLGTPWPFQATGAIVAAPAIDYVGTIFAVTAAGRLYRVSATGAGAPIYDAGAAVTTSPALALGGVASEGAPPGVAAVYLGSENGILHCVGPDGALLWRLEPGLTQPTTGVSLRSAPAVYRELGTTVTAVYIGCDDGRVFAVVESGPMAASTAWEFAVGSPVRTSPALTADGRTVYVAAADGSLHTLDAGSGQPLHPPVNLSGSSLHTPAVAASGVAYVTTADGFLHAVDPAGQLLWSVSLGLDLYAGPSLGLDDEVLVVAAGSLHAVDSGGTLLWSEPLPTDRFPHAPVVDGAGIAALSSSAGAVIGIRTDTGLTGSRIAWQVNTSGTALASLAIDGHGRIFVGDRDGRLHAIDDQPAFRLYVQSDLAQGGNLDVYSLRETYGVLDPVRTLRLTQDTDADRQPAASLDRRVIGYVSYRSTSDDAVIATPVGTRQQVITPPVAPFSATSAETSPAFTPLDDRLGTPKPPHIRDYTAVTTDVAGLRRLRFVDPAAVPGSAQWALTFTAWATALGVPPPLAAQLEPAQVEQSHAAFAPDGRKIAWRHSDRSTGTGRVWMLLLTSAGWQLTPVGPTYPYNAERPDPSHDEPCFSPDSRWIAVHESLSVAIYDVFGVQAPVYTSPPQGGDEPCHPSWAPDGSEIAVGVRRGASVDVQVASGANFAQYAPLTGTGTTDEPSYDFFRMPPPQVISLDTDRQVPAATVQLRGRGFDILHPENNTVDFADSRHTGRIVAQVLTASVDPYLGLGVLTVRIPLLAGHGSIRVTTRFGTVLSPDFHVLPDPSNLVQRRTVPGALIRVFGRGFDLSPASQHTILFGAAAGGTVSAAAQSGEVVGNREFLVVRVPQGVAPVATVRVENPYGGRDCPVTLGLLTPIVTLLRPVASGPTPAGTAPPASPAGLPSYAGQGAAGAMVTVRGSGFPFDPYFGYGTTSASLTADIAPALQPTPPLPAVPIRTLGFAATGPDTADLATATFAFPGLGPGHPGGVLRILAADSNLPAAAAQTTFRVPETNIPIIFVPGTSGTSLDIAPGVFTPITASMPFHIHTFPWLSQNPLPWPLNPFGPLYHFGRNFTYSPTTPNTYPPPGPVFDHPGDSRGPRVWAGPEGVAEVLNTTLTGNVGNHYLDICAFDSTGSPVHPEIVPGTVIEDAMVTPPVFSGSVNAWGFVEEYKPVIEFLNTPNMAKSWPGRPVCRSANPATGVCLDANGNAASGRNAVYLFNLDWRQSVPTEAARLATFIDAVRGRPDVAGRKVAIITHSYGGPVARAYYLDPASGAQAKIDQVISLGGGFLGVVQPMDILEQGGSWGFGFSLGPLGLGVQPWETQSLAQNWPTAYFQMPNSEAWFADHGATIGGRVINRSYIRDYRPLIPGIVSGAGEITSYAASNAWIGLRHNGALATAQTGFFAPVGGPTLPMGDFTNGTGMIYHHRIVGKGRMDTVVATAVRWGPSLDAWVYLPGTPESFAANRGTQHWESVYGDGDSTIPYHGAIGLTDPQDDRIYVLDGAKHSDLPLLPEIIGQGSVKGLLELLLEGAVGSINQAPPPFGSQNQMETLAVPVPLAVRGAEPDRQRELADRWLVEVTGLAQLDVTDADGNHLGPHPRLPDGIEERIPGASYRPGPPVTTVFLPAGRYDLRVTAKVRQALRIRVRRYAGAEVLSSLLFRELAVEPGDIARFTLARTTSLDAAAWLTVEPGGGGAQRRIAANVLTPAQSEDTAPPRTWARISDGTLVVDADDSPGGSGVYRTIVSLNGTDRISYDGPLAVPLDATMVMAYSEDAAGNLEYPGWVAGALGISAPEVQFRHDSTAPEDIEVVNLDPLSISPPISWRAMSAVPWVRLEPPSGQTPQSLRVWIDPTLLPPDDGEVSGEITITVNGSDAVVASRTLLVTVLPADAPDARRVQAGSSARRRAGSRPVRGG